MKLACRVYLLCEKLKVLRRKAPARLLRRLLPNQPIWVQVRSGLAAGLWMRLHLRSESRFWLGKHEPLLQTCLIDMIQPGIVLYDVGAHVGSIALGFARAIRPWGGRVVAFEPDPQNADTLRENRDRNGLAELLEVVPCAVWSSSSTDISFREGGGNKSHGGVEAGVSRPVLGNGDLISVTAISLDDFVAKGGLIPHLIKVDVEGGEFEVLRGAEQLFAKYQPLLIAEVHHKEAEREIRSWLKGIDYASHWIAPPEQYPCCVFGWAAHSPNAQNWSLKLTGLK